MYVILRICQPLKVLLKSVVGFELLFGECGRLQRVRFRLERAGAFERTVRRALPERATSAMYFTDAGDHIGSRFTCRMNWRQRSSRPSTMAVSCMNWRTKLECGWCVH